MGVECCVARARNGRGVLRGLFLLLALVGLVGALEASGGREHGPTDEKVIVVPADTGPCSRTYPPNTGVHGVLALGDSYSAGEGLGGTVSNCYEPGTATGSNECHRSAWAYSAGVLPDYGHYFRACSGALTADVLYRPKNGELPQSYDTGSDWLVSTLTIGGNDVGFASVIKACTAVNFVKAGVSLGTWEGATGYVDGEVYSTTPSERWVNENCPGWLAKADTAIAQMEDRLVQTYLTVLEGPGERQSGLVRGSKLLVGTYPNLFPSSWTGSSTDDEGHRFCEGANIDIDTMPGSSTCCPTWSFPNRRSTTSMSATPNGWWTQSAAARPPSTRRSATP